MKKYGNRSLALLLTLLLCLSLLPAAALAEGEQIINGEADFVCEIGGQGYGTLVGAIEAVSEDSADPTEIVLVANTKERVTIPASKSVTLDLNGFTLTGTGDSVITNSGTLTVTDSSTEGTGTITLSPDSLLSESGGGVYNRGSFTMAGGTISGCASFARGGGVFNDGVFTMTGGTITGCTAISGGGVYNEDTFTMSGGTITGCSANGFDGGGYGGGVSNYGSFTMSGGMISGCTSSAYGGGIYSYVSLTLSYGSITGCSAGISGGGVYAAYEYLGICADPDSTAPLTVTGNTAGAEASNLVLTENIPAITFDGVPANGSSVGITTAAEPTEEEPVVFTSGYGMEGAPDPAGLFVPDNVNFAVGTAADGEVQLTTAAPVIIYDPPVTVTVSVNDKTATLTGTIQNNKLKLDDSINNINAIKNLAGENSTGLVMDISAVNGVSGVSLAGDLLAELQNSGKELTVVNQSASVTLPADVIGTLSIKNEQSVSVAPSGIAVVDLPIEGFTARTADIRLNLTGNNSSSGPDKPSSNITLSSYVGQDGKTRTNIDGGSAIVAFAVSQSEIASNGLTPGNAALYHQEKDGGWTPLPTKYEVSGGQVKYTAMTSSFSPFALVFDDDAVKNCPKDDTCPLDRFTDADNTAWYHDGVHFCINAGLMIGVSDSAFDPAGTMSRAMAVTVLWRLEGRPCANYAMTFTDIPEDSWYTEAVRWAASEGIVTGYSAEAFGPDDPVTREQLALMLYGYARSNGNGFTDDWMFLLDYEDADTVSDWADEAMHWCAMKGIITGYDGRLNPQSSASRAEAAAMLQRFCS